MVSIVVVLSGNVVGSGGVFVVVVSKTTVVKTSFSVVVSRVSVVISLISPIESICSKIDDESAAVSIIAVRACSRRESDASSVPERLTVISISISITSSVDRLFLLDELKDIELIETASIESNAEFWVL